MLQSSPELCDGRVRSLLGSGFGVVRRQTGSWPADIVAAYHKHDCVGARLVGPIAVELGRRRLNWPGIAANVPCERYYAYPQTKRRKMGPNRSFPRLKTTFNGTNDFDPDRTFLPPIGIFETDAQPASPASI